MKVLTICPSIRTDRIETMKESFYATSTVSSLLILTQPGSITKIINDTFWHFPNYDYYHITNDDFVYRTEGWDQSLQTQGISYGNDLLSKGLPSAPFIKGDIARAVGWLQLPTLEHLCGDCVWRDIGQRLNRLYYFQDVVIEHCHCSNLKAVDDDVYRKTNSKQMFQQDNKAYRHWLRTQAAIDIEKVRSVL